MTQTTSVYQAGLFSFSTELHTVQERRGARLVNVEVLSEKGGLLFGRLPAVIGQDLPQGLHGALRLAQSEELPTDGEVDVVLSERPAPVLVHLHGLAVAAQGVSPLGGREKTKTQAGHVFKGNLD